MSALGQWTIFALLSAAPSLVLTIVTQGNSDLTPFLSTLSWLLFTILVWRMVGKWQIDMFERILWTILGIVPLLGLVTFVRNASRRASAVTNQTESTSVAGLGSHGEETNEPPVPTRSPNPIDTEPVAAIGGNMSTNEYPGVTHGESIEDLHRAVLSGAASLAPRQDVAREWVSSRGAPLTRGQRIFHYVMAWSAIWATAIMVYFAWRALGPAALFLFLVALLSAFVNRPWRGTGLLAVAGIVTLSAGVAGYPWIAWIAGTWLLVGFLYDGWHNWCTDRFTEQLLRDEEFFVKMYQAQNTAVRLKTGELLMCKSIVT
jgi:hypothetical protein